MKRVLVLILMAAPLTAFAQLTVEGRVWFGGDAVVIGPWGEETPVDVRGKKKRRYAVTIDDRNVAYELRWQCPDGVHTVRVWMHTPSHVDRITQRIEVCGCDPSKPETTYVYWSATFGEFVHLPGLIDYDRAVFEFLRIPLPK